MSVAQPSQNPRLPADLGLPALGLLAQAQALFVTFYLTLLAFIAMLPYTEGGARVGLIGLLALGAIRAGLHHNAGSALVARAPYLFAAVRRYIIGAIATTLAMGGILTALLGGLPVPMYLVIALVGLAWPATLGLLVYRRDVRDAFEAADTFDLSLVPGDRSVEGVGVLMTVLASVGVGAALIALTLVLELPLDDIHVILMLVLVVLLLVRAALHLDAGVRAIRGVTPVRFEALAQRYLLLAVATVGALGLFLLIASHGRGLPMVLVTFLLGAGMLLTWPLILRRFATQVRLDDLGDDDQAPFGPAPDRGLTAFGFLLAVVGANQLALALSALLVGAPDLGGLASLLGEVDVAFDPLQLVTVAAAVVTLWAAREAIVMSSRRHLALYAYAAVVVASGVVDWIANGFPLADADSPSAIATAIAAITVQLAVPLTGLLLLRRRLPARDEATPPQGVPALD